MWKGLILLVTITALLSTASCQTCSLTDDEFLVTFHPHMDAFWLNSDEELKNINFVPQGFLYNMNQRNSKTIFNSMLTALSENKLRKYFVTEIVFFKDWYDYLPLDKKTKVKQLLLDGQLEVANGGWVENDEAVCYYDDVLDQYTLGMKFLYNQMDYQVKVGWATDSFGHSHSQAALEHLLGIQFQGIQRVDDRYVNLHKNSPLLQFYWTPVSDSNNLTYGGVMNQVRHFLHEVNNLRGSRIESIKQDFSDIQKVMKNYYHKNKLFRFLGNDFEEFVTEQFVNLENAMNALNQQKSATCPAFKYGNPSDYLDMVTKYYDQNTLPTRTWDFIPNWDQDRYWTGYYTTDPQLKIACKDFSRLVNFYRKSILAFNNYPDNSELLQRSEELLAVLQHHDGITATSKTYIEDDFKNRAKVKTDQIFQKLIKMHGGSDTVLCKFHSNQNECQIPDSEVTGPDARELYIVAHGGSRKQKIQIGLPSETFYDITDHNEDIFCEQSKCVLVFEAPLHAGVNKFSLSKKSKDQMSSQIFELKKVESNVWSGSDFTFTISPQSQHQIKYEYFGSSQYITIGLYTSPNQGSSRQTMSWDKYGRRNDKTEHVVPGMYIMSNNGKIQPIRSKFNSFKSAEGKLFKRVILNSAVSTIKITVTNEQLNIIDVVHAFKPEDRSMVDYFMKVSSTVKSDTLYHDSNGFLVANRTLNQRPDYEIIAKPEDAINGNTYPACSFAYFKEDGKKFLFFTDRAQGVASFQKSLLINFDRLAMDDGKGVGEGYYRVVNNTFRYKFALLSAQDDTERTWQRAYDEALVGFFSKSSSANIISSQNTNNLVAQTPGLGPMNNLKYSLFYVTPNEIVLRFQNMGEFSNLIFTKYQGSQGAYQWSIDELGLNLKFSDINESYANGIPKESNKSKWRRHWGVKNDQINLANQGKLDGDRLGLRPLEIRSFRINFKGLITAKETNSRAVKNNPALKQISSATHLKRTKLRKRCF